MRRNHTMIAIALLAISTTALGGCSYMRFGAPGTDEFAKQQAEQIAELKSALADRDHELNALRAQAPSGDGAESAGSGDSLVPPNAKVGHCYARVLVPAEFRTETEQVVKRDAGERLEIIPAEYEFVDEKVLIKEATTEYESVAPKYKWVEEKVLVRPASEVVEQVPAKYESSTEEVLVRPAQTVWKKGRGLIERVDNATGEILCLINEPPLYRTVTKRKMVSPPTARKREVPAEYKTIRKRVIDVPGASKPVEIPAEYKTVKVRKLVKPAEEKRVPVPAEYQTVNKKVKLTDSRLEWRPVLCETNASGDLIKEIQTALQKAGHEPGPIDGKFGRKTAAAVRSFQAANDLPTGGLTMATVEKLGISAH